MKLKSGIILMPLKGWGTMKFKTGRALACVALVGGIVVAMMPSVSSAAAKTVSDSTFNANFTTMKLLKPIVAKGKGSIAVILPDTVSSARWADFDAPAFKKAFADAGLKKSQYIVQNALGSDQTQYTDAQADIAKGAKVLILTPLDSTTGAVIEAYAVARGVKVIDYDRLTLGGARTYYVSFNNVAVGTLIGKGLLTCITNWKVSDPVVFVMKGAPTDNNATLFAQGYDKVLDGGGYNTTSGSANTVLESVGTWTPSVALTDFEGAYAANPKINAVVTPNDENAGPIIAHLQAAGLKPNVFPFTGQDATPVGIDNIISGYQCGTVYKPSWDEAEATASLAIYLRAKIKAPAGLVNGTTTDSGATIKSFKNVPSILLTPEWVTASTVESTVIKDKVLTAKDVCLSTAPTVAGDSSIPTYAADCTTYGIK
jgi:D-xylose transport system substrate-binding protein